MKNLNLFFRFHISSFDFGFGRIWTRNFKIRILALWSVELRSRKIWWEREDLNLQPAPSHGAALNPIAPRPQNWRKAEDSNPYASDAAVFKTAATPIWLAFHIKFVRDEGGKLFLLSCWKLAGALRFELKTSVLETGVLPIETTRLCKFGVSDGSRTRNRRFGRPALSHLSFAHKFWCIGKDLNFQSSETSDSFTDCLP